MATDWSAITTKIPTESELSISLYLVTGDLPCYEYAIGKHLSDNDTFLSSARPIIKSSHEKKRVVGNPTTLSVLKTDFA